MTEHDSLCSCGSCDKALEEAKALYQNLATGDECLLWVLQVLSAAAVITARAISESGGSEETITHVMNEMSDRTAEVDINQLMTEGLNKSVN